MESTKKNIDDDVVKGFGDEWVRFDQSKLTEDEQLLIFNQYFSIFPWDSLPEKASGFDAGCGSGRWAEIVAGRVFKLNVIDASSDALNVARAAYQASDLVKTQAALTEVGDAVDLAYRSIPGSGPRSANCTRRNSAMAAIEVFC